MSITTKKTLCQWLSVVLIFGLMFSALFVAWLVHETTGDYILPALSVLPVTAIFAGLIWINANWWNKLCKQERGE